MDTHCANLSDTQHVIVANLNETQLNQESSEASQKYDKHTSESFLP